MNFGSVPPLRHCIPGASATFLTEKKTPNTGKNAGGCSIRSWKNRKPRAARERTSTVARPLHVLRGTGPTGKRYAQPFIKICTFRYYVLRTIRRLERFADEKY
jgi:hypothetical protein